MYPNVRLDGSALLNELREVVVHATAGENSVRLRPWVTETV
jgi:hypothetical protein